MTQDISKTQPIRVGVIGVGRGQSFASGATELVGMKLVALCDTWEEKLREAGQRYGVATYTDYDKFLEHDMDAVVLANYFHEHAPFAIKALQAGKHVMSECTCNATLRKAWPSAGTVERSGLIYMLAENYPFTRFNMEMRRLYRTGEIGRVTYAEGEYNHPMARDDIERISPGLQHWRNWLPSTYYCTHALAPLMCITDTMPVSVNALSIAVPEVDRAVAALQRSRLGHPLPHGLTARCSASSASGCRGTATGIACTARTAPWRSPAGRATSVRSRCASGTRNGIARPATRSSGLICRSGPNTPNRGAGRSRRRRFLDEFRLRQRHPRRQAALPRCLSRRGHEQRGHPGMEKRTDRRRPLSDARLPLRNLARRTWNPITGPPGRSTPAPASPRPPSAASSNRPRRPSRHAQRIWDEENRQAGS